MIIALVSIVAVSAFAVDPGWGGNTSSVTIPVIMDIAPVCSIDLNDAVIKLELSDESVAGAIVYEGVADPEPQLHSNVQVDISASIEALEPTIVDGSPFQVALRNLGYDVTSGPVTYDPMVLDYTPGIEVHAAITNPDLTVRPEGLDVPVALVTLTVTPAAAL